MNFFENELGEKMINDKSFRAPFLNFMGDILGVASLL